jgi:serine phosphatase RsbU (regulator of sigma subunit)
MSQPRKGAPISVKMILTTTALIVLTVAGFGALNLWTIRNIYDVSVQEKEALFRTRLHKVGTATVMAVAASSRGFFEASNDADLRKYIGDIARRDATIRAVYVVDAAGGLVAHSDAAKNPSEGHPPVAEKTWTSIQAAWKERLGKGPGEEPLIASLEVEGVALFALPVFPAGVPGTVRAALAPEGDASRPLGFVVLAYSFDELQAQITEAIEQQKQAYRQTGFQTAGVGALFVLVGALLAIFQGLRISKPIKLLAWRADQIARGDLAARAEVTSGDEIGLLAENFNYMADQIVVLLRQAAEKATLEKELELARTIQDTLVPGQEQVDRQFLKLAGYFQPASTCGGDWWTYHDLPDGRVLVVIGDVTGHGVSSAMITAAAKAACDVARATNPDLTCDRLLEVMNRAIFESARRKFVMTCFASIVDPRNRTITYANAGHNFPYLYREHDGKGEFGSLMIRGNRLGDLMDSKYVSKTMELLPGDVLVWYTDGIVECENDQGEEYGEKRFRSSIRRASAQEPDGMRDSVIGACAQFAGDRPRKDDITMVFARVY